MTASAQCSACGAPVPISGLQLLRCRHCGGAPFLPPPAAARLEGLRNQIARAGAKTQQLDGQLADFGQGVGFLEVGTAALLWAVIGGLLTAGAAGNLGDDDTFFGVLLDPPANALDTFAAATFWMSLLTVLGFSACCTAAAIARLVARRQVRFAFPEPPAYPGGPPGCRVCGAELASRGVVRRCRHCGADNLVDGVHFQHVSEELDARLQSRERAVQETLASRQRMVAALEKLVLGPPFATLLLAPLVLWFGQPDAVWWVLPAGLLATAGALFALTAALPHPRAHGGGR